MFVLREFWVSLLLDVLPSILQTRSKKGTDYIRVLDLGEEERTVFADYPHSHCHANLSLEIRYVAAMGPAGRRPRFNQLTDIRPKYGGFRKVF